MEDIRYKIKDVAKRVNVPVSTIRYWQKVFSDYIKPDRTEGGQRRYSGHDIEFFIKIREMLYEKRRSIAQVKHIILHGDEGREKIDWSQQSVLITGGTGSFGRHFCSTLLERYNPKVIRVFSRGEVEQQRMRNELDDTRLRFFIGDVRDKDRLQRAMDNVDLVVHAAALKQVSACEYNPFEAVKTNIIGAQNLIDAAIDTGVKKVIAISTDKAVNPANLYGATKLCAEKLIIQGNAYSTKDGARFSAVRYGNVIGSRGSVIPLFEQQRKRGKLTVTDRRMTRFWISLSQAVDLVVKAFDYMQGGEVFVPKIPSMKIVDLAQALAPSCDLEFIGAGPGEKLHEILITEVDGRNTLEYNDMYVVLPQHSWWERKELDSGRYVRAGFVYASNQSDWWLSAKELREIVANRDERSKGENPIRLVK